MPKLAIDYSKALIYKLVCKDVSIKDCYVGSTTNITKRRNCHKSSSINKNCKNYDMYVYQFIRENGDWNNWDMVEVEKYACEDKQSLHTRERFWIETLNATLNKFIPTRTQKEYRIDKHEDIVKQNKEYREKNKDKIKEYYEKNKEKISEYYKKYNEQNKEQITEKKKEYQEKNKDKIKEYYEKNKEQITEKNQLTNLNTTSS